MSSKDIFKPEAEGEKCAPSKIFSDGSCFTIGSLRKIVDAHNRHVGSNSKLLINSKQSKKQLVDDLTNRIKSCGSDQLCWLDIGWIKKIKDIDIHKNTFRPKGPQGRFKWLSTTDINDITTQYEAKYNDFKFLGAVPYNFEDLDQLGINNLNFNDLIQNNINKIGMVINFDEHWQNGSHWVGLYADLQNDKIYYFDSYGSKPKKRIADFVGKIARWCYFKHKVGEQNNLSNNINTDTDTKFMTGGKKNKYEQIMNIAYNQNRHQFKSSECGVYSVNFILRLLKGETFDSITNNITTDDAVNECRKTYFRFK
jgi:hypothetical protein